MPRVWLGALQPARVFGVWHLRVLGMQAIAQGQVRRAAEGQSHEGVPAHRLQPAGSALPREAQLARRRVPAHEAVPAAASGGGVGREVGREGRARGGAEASRGGEVAGQQGRRCWRRRRGREGEEARVEGARRGVEGCVAAESHRRRDGYRRPRRCRRARWHRQTSADDGQRSRQEAPALVGHTCSCEGRGRRVREDVRGLRHQSGVRGVLTCVGVASAGSKSRATDRDHDLQLRFYSVDRYHAVSTNVIVELPPSSV
mmetsp:Transcript_26663/g.92634  ORF Transcript_26663/g.92634 Transcript_26663/m.92634 type:complete len:258 (-) Transcript_26663:62-835(-)